MSLSDSEVALLAAEAGAAVVRRHFRGPVEKHHKVGTDFATDADLEAESAIREVLTEHRPDDGQLGEEHGASGPDTVRRWLIDPLCGTRNFAAGLPLMSSNVALSVDGEVTVGASAECVGDEVYWTDGITGWVRRDGQDAELRPDPSSLLVGVHVVPEPRERCAGSELLAHPRFLMTYEPRVTSTTLALAWVAAGRHAAYVTEGDMVANVHFAAGLAVCRAAGCVVTDLDGGPVDTGAGTDRSGRAGVLAAGDRATHVALMEMLQQHPV